jgi:hypothetical protein
MLLLLISRASLRFRNSQEKCEIMKYRYSLICQGTVGAVGCNICNGEEGHIVLDYIGGEWKHRVRTIG